MSGSGHGVKLKNVDAGYLQPERQVLRGKNRIGRITDLAFLFDYRNWKLISIDFQFGMEIVTPLMDKYLTQSQTNPSVIFDDMYIVSSTHGTILL